MKNTNHSLFDKYEMIKDLGTGSSGSVTLVRHISMDQERALKKVPKSSAFSESALSEARLLKSLEHPSIPRIFDFEEDDAFYYIVEEYIDGETLDSFLLHQQLISPGLFFNICEQLCNVFIYLHTQISTPIIYRDLKPEHIIVCLPHHQHRQHRGGPKDRPRHPDAGALRRGHPLHHHRPRWPDADGEPDAGRKERLQQRQRQHQRRSPSGDAQ